MTVLAGRDLAIAAGARTLVSGLSFEVAGGEFVCVLGENGAGKTLTLHTLAGLRAADAGHVNFLTRLDGELIGRLPFERQRDECLEHTPTPLRNISQHRLEPLLAGEVGTMHALAPNGDELWRRRTRLDASSIRSMALSGRWRSVM